MGFNAVLASTMGARNFVARRQMDKRVKLLLPLNGNLDELSGGAEVITINNSYQWVAAPYSNGQAWKRTNTNNQMQISLLGPHFNDDWSLEFFWKRYDSVIDIATIGDRKLSSAGEDFYITTVNTIVHTARSIVYTGVWNHYRESYSNGIGSCYYNGNIVYTYTENILNNVLGFTLGLNGSNNRGLIAFCNVRLTTVGTSASTVPIPTAPFTGFEPLG